MTKFGAYTIAFLICILPFGIPERAFSQPLESGIANRVSKEVRMPRTDFSVNLNISEDDLQPSKAPKWKEDQQEYPQDIDGLWDYITRNKAEKATPYIRLAQLLRQEGRAEESFQAMNKGLTRIGDAMDADPSNMEFPTEAAAIFHFAGEPQQNISLWEKVVQSNPGNSKAWSNLAFWEALLGKLDRAAEDIEKAYSLNPADPQIYVSEFMHLLFGVIVKMQESEDEDVKVMDYLDLTFLQKAVREHPNLECAMVAYHAIRTMTALWQVSMDNSESFQLEEPVAFKLSPAISSVLAETRTYFSPKMKNYSYPLLPLKLMLMETVLTGKEKEGEDWYQRLTKAYPKDGEAHRIMGMMYFPMVKLAKIEACMKADLAVNPSSQGYQALARIQLEQGEVSAASQSLTQSTQLGGHPGMHPLMMATHSWQKGSYEAGNQFFQAAKDVGLEQFYPDFAYFDALHYLFSGNVTEGKNQLKGIPEQSDFYTSSQAILSLLP